MEDRMQERFEKANNSRKIEQEKIKEAIKLIIIPLGIIMHGILGILLIMFSLFEVGNGNELKTFCCVAGSLILFTQLMITGGFISHVLKIIGKVEDFKRKIENIK